MMGKLRIMANDEMISFADVFFQNKSNNMAGNMRRGRNSKSPSTKNEMFMPLKLIIELLNT